MTLADLYIAILSEGDHYRLPQQPLSLRFIPISTAPPHTDSHKKLTSGAELHHRGAIRVRDPDIIFCVDGHAVRLFLVTDHVIADLQDKFVIRAELRELRTSSGLALKDDNTALRIQGNHQYTTCARSSNI